MKMSLKSPKKPQRSSSNISDSMRIFAWNIILIGITGVLASFWIIRYTDWFPVVGGILALGGVFSWLAFVSNILEEERVKVLKRRIDETIFSRHRTAIVVILFLIAGLIATSLFGTVQIQSLSGGSASCGLRRGS